MIQSALLQLILTGQYEVRVLVAMLERVLVKKMLFYHYVVEKPISLVPCVQLLIPQHVLFIELEEQVMELIGHFCNSFIHFMKLIILQQVEL